MSNALATQQTSDRPVRSSRNTVPSNRTDGLFGVQLLRRESLSDLLDGDPTINRHPSYNAPTTATRHLDTMEPQLPVDEESDADSVIQIHQIHLKQQLLSICVLSSRMKFDFRFRMMI